MLPDGRVQRVRYSVEGPHGGFKAVVSYEGKTKIPKPRRPRPQRPNNKSPTVRVKNPSYDSALKTVGSVPTYAGSTPGPSLASALTPQFSHPRPTIVKFQQESEPKLMRYSYKTLPEKYPEPAATRPSSGLSPTLKGRERKTEKTTANELLESRTATPPPTPHSFSFSHRPPGFQDRLPPRTSSNYHQNPPPDVPRRFTYRPVEAEEDEEGQEDEEEDDDDNFDDGNERTKNIHVDHLEVVQPFVVGAPSTSSPRLHPPPKEPFRDSAEKTLSPNSPLHYSLSSSPYPPLHHPYVFQDQLYPLPSVKRYTFKKVPDEDEGEEEADVDAEDDGAEVSEESLEESNETETGDKVDRIGYATGTDEPDPDKTQEKSNEMDNDSIQMMTIHENLVLPESEIWGYRYLP